jgi:hypothetical protein
MTRDDLNLSFVEACRDAAVLIQRGGEEWNLAEVESNDEPGTK